MSGTISTNDTNHRERQLVIDNVKSELLLWEHIIIGNNGVSVSQKRIIDCLEQILVRIGRYVKVLKLAKLLQVEPLETLCSEMVAYLPAIRNGEVYVDDRVILTLLDWRNTFAGLVEELSTTRKEAAIDQDDSEPGIGDD